MKRIYSMNAGWKFRRETSSAGFSGTDDFDMFSGYTKTGALQGPGSDSFCDADWKEVRLPHDALTEESFDPKGAQGFKPREAVWYRKTFEVPADWDGSRIFLRFDGVACRSSICLNNICIAKSESTYTPISVEITDLLHYGQPNLLSVRADNFRSEGWWYDGCGIYRSVWLTVTEETRFAENGVFVSARPEEEDNWRLQIRAEIDRPAGGQLLHVSCLDAEGEIPVTGSFVKLTLPVKNPLLWSMETPNLTPVTVTLTDREGHLFDEETIPFGFRTVQFDPESGCLLNGEPVKLKGVCLHHDHAGVGTALSYPLHRYRLERLRDMGCNAIRTSHNPQDPEFYKACDELGFAVMDETRHFSSAPEELRQLRTMIRRDRNHPSVFLWSLFNEEPLQCSAMGEKIARTMKRIADEEDGTRPVTGGMNGPLECEGAVHVVDVMGFNYLQYGYDEFHARFPELSVVGSETASYLSERGEWKDADTETLLRRSAFGRKRSDGVHTRTVNLHMWSDTPGDTWKRIAERPFVAGGFAWTGFDYRGETDWPGVIADFGAMDLCGFPKDAFYWNRSLWKEEPTLHLSCYPDGKGSALLCCYANADRLRIIPEGNPPIEADFDPFDPCPCPVPAGIPVTVEAFRNGEKLGEERWVPAKAPARLHLSCTRKDAPEGEAVAFNVSLFDEDGRLVDSEEPVSFSAESGEILGVGNGDSCSHEPDCANTRKLYHGCAQAIVRAGTGEALTVSARCGGLCAETTVPIRPVRIPEIPSCEPWLRICPWRMSDVTDTPPRPDQIHDFMYNWIPTMAGVSQSLMMSGKHGFACFSGEFTAPEAPCVLHLTGIAGHFDLYLNGEKLLSSADEDIHSYHLPLPDALFGKRGKLSLVFTCTGGIVRVGEIYLTCL